MLYQTNTVYDPANFILVASISLSVYLSYYFAAHIFNFEFLVDATSLPSPNSTVYSCLLYTFTLFYNKEHKLLFNDKIR